MSLSAALGAALSGLSAAQRQTALVSSNIANASTPGYVGKEAALAPLVLGGEGRGVMVTGVLRHVDAALQRDARREGGRAGGLDLQAAQLKALRDLVGQPDQESDPASLLAKLEAAFQALGESPDDVASQRAVVQAARGLTRVLNGLSQQIGTLRTAADAGIAAAVATVNGDLQQLARLNAELVARTGAGDDGSELLDQRDRLLDAVAQEIGITSFTRGDGELVVLSSGGSTLLDGTAVSPLAFTATPLVTATARYGSGLSGVSVAGQDVTPGHGSPQGLEGGRLAAQAALRDQLLPQAQAQLDELASVLADAFQRHDATVTPGAAGLFTDAGAAHDRGDAAAIVGLAGRLAVNSRVVPEQGGALWRLRAGVQAATPNAAGDATQLRAFQAAFGETQSFAAGAGLATSASLGGYAAAFAGSLGDQQTGLAEAAQQASPYADTLRTRRQDLEGVNVDEETQRLLLLEQSYNASAHVVKAVQEMLDTLLNL